MSSRVLLALRRPLTRQSLLRLSPVLGNRGLSFTPVRNADRAQSASPLGPIGVEAALKAANDPSFIPKPTIFKEFDLTGRVAVVSGGNRGLGLEMAEALCELGAIVYSMDLPSSPGPEWKATSEYVDQLELQSARLEYVSVDVTDQKAIWDVVQKIAEKEGRMDVCIAAAGILQSAKDCLEYPAADFQKVSQNRIDSIYAHKYFR